METLSLTWSDDACDQLMQIIDQNPNIRHIDIYNSNNELVHCFNLESESELQSYDVNESDAPKPEGNAVAHPSHYNQGKYEVKDVIRDWNLNFNLGNAIKYIARAPYKHPDRIIEDYEKAKQYIDFEIEYLKGN